MATNELKVPKRSKADWWLFVVGFVVAAAFGWVITPVLIYAEKPQPMQFSHKVHGENGDAGKTCEECHGFREDGSFAGIPSVQSCKECHEDVMGETPDEKVLVENYVKGDKPIKWQIYYKQPPCVFFSHAVHVKSAGFECTRCHGDHGTSEKMPPYQENRLTGYSRNIWGWNISGFADPPNRMKMDDCADCHRDNGIRDACFVCHK